MVVSMVGCWWDSVAHATALLLAWEKVRGSWNCESGAGLDKVVMEICGAIFEGWLGVDVDYR